MGVLNLFLPSGTPIVIVPFLIIIEIISYFARVFSLGIRLFANMMAGHTLLKILCSYTWPLLLAIDFLSLNLYFVPFLIVVLISCLEFAIALLQAYVFTVLVCLYLNDAFQSSH